MTTPTFEKLVWELVKDDRDKVLVVDNHHAYAIIKDRIDSFWEQVRLAQPDENQLVVLGGLVAMAAYAQLSAENLSLVPEQQSRDETADAAEEEAKQAKGQLKDLLLQVLRGSRPIKELQRGVKRYAFEFDEHTANALKGLVGELE